MPPQQPDRLLDLSYQTFDFGAHELFRSAAFGRHFVNACEGCSGMHRKAQSACAFDRQ
jgi:hypothetical protein